LEDGFEELQITASKSKKELPGESIVDGIHQPDHIDLFHDQAKT